MLLGRLLGFRVGLEEMLVMLDERRERAAMSGPQVGRHMFIGREHRGCRADLGTHVGDGRLAGGADGARAGPDVFDDRIRAAGDGQHAGDGDDHVLGGRPAVELTREVDGDALGIEQLPWQAGYGLHGICAAHTDGTCAEST